MTGCEAKGGGSERSDEVGVGCRCTQSVVGGSCRAAEGNGSQLFLFCIGLLLAARAYATQKPGRRARLTLDAEETPPGQLGVDKGQRWSAKWRATSPPTSTSYRALTRRQE